MPSAYNNQVYDHLFVGCTLTNYKVNGDLTSFDIGEATFEIPNSPASCIAECTIEYQKLKKTLEEMRPSISPLDLK